MDADVDLMEQKRPRLRHFIKLKTGLNDPVPRQHLKLATGVQMAAESGILNL